MASEERPADSGAQKKKVDESWKQRAKTEKERDSQKVEQGPSAATDTAEGRPRDPLPEPTLTALFIGLATQALVGLGEAESPITGQKEKDLDFAKYNIDMLQSLEDKTKGNLAPAEKVMLTQLLYDLRMRYVKAAQ